MPLKVVTEPERATGTVLIGICRFGWIIPCRGGTAMPRTRRRTLP